MIKIIKFTFSNSILKVSSLVIAFSIWVILSQNKIIEINKKANIFFYNNEGYQIEGAGEINLNLTGKKHIFFLLNKDMSIFIDANEIKENVPFILTENNLYLPAGIKLIDYQPRNLKFKISKA